MEDAGLHLPERLRRSSSERGIGNLSPGYTLWQDGRAVAGERVPRDLRRSLPGLRAGGALRKQRRGEPLTREERDALGRWQRLSFGRKAFAIGALALGTFGLGFTLGGLIFGRWRKA